MSVGATLVVALSLGRHEACPYYFGEMVMRLRRILDDKTFGGANRRSPLGGRLGEPPLPFGHCAKSWRNEHRKFSVFTHLAMNRSRRITAKRVITLSR